MDWQPIETAPYGKIVWIKNDMMENPVLATRGYTHNGAVHEDQSFFTTVYTPDRFFPTPAGNLAVPNVWAEYIPPQ
ncbi:MAG: hypothetical protein ACPGFA_01170 [Pikeienuella sp.]